MTFQAVLTWMTGVSANHSQPWWLLPLLLKFGFHGPSMSANNTKPPSCVCILQCRLAKRSFRAL